MERVHKNVDVNASPDEVYNQWRDFSALPRFMDGIESVEQKEDGKYYWEAQIAGQTERWVAEMTEDTPGNRIAWRSVEGAKNRGTVTFEPLEGGSKTRLGVEIEYEPEDIWEKMAASVGGVDSKVENSLEDFKKEMDEREGAAR